MTLTADIVGDLHSAGDTLAASDPDADFGSFSMSPASAEQVTIQICTMMDRSWEYISLAYKGRAFAALGFPSWDAYVDARLDGCRLCVPRESRAEAVAALADIQMSVRAIAKLLGVGIGTVHRELANRPPTGVHNGTPDDQGPDKTLGRDGKSYPRHRPPSPRPCALCGEKHPIDTEECPWDLSAQGRRPNPVGTGTDQPEPDHTGERNGPGSRTSSRADTRPGNEGTSQSEPRGSDREDLTTGIDIVDRIQHIVDDNTYLAEQLADLAHSLMTSDDATWSDLLRHRLRKLADPLRSESIAWSALVQQIDRVTTG